MPDSHRYVMLLTSLPHHGALFAARVTPLSRLRLRERFTLLDPEDRQELDAVSALLDWYRHPARKTDAEMVQLAKTVVPTLKYPFSRELVSWRLELRTLVSALRRRYRGVDMQTVDYEWGYGRWQAHLRNYWQESCFRLEGVYPWLPEALRLMNLGSPVALERLFLEVVWNHLQRLEDGHAFDFERVLIYLSRWDLVGRWTAADGELAKQRYAALVEEGLEQIEGLMDPALTG